MEGNFSLEVHRDRPRGDGYKVHHEKFCLELRKKFHSLHREVIESLFLVNTWLEKTLSNPL